MSWIRTIYTGSMALANTRKKQRQFLLLLFGVFTLWMYKIYGINDAFYLRISHFGMMTFFLFLSPFLIYPVLLLWFMIGKFLGELVSSILLVIVYFVFMAPLRLFLRYDHSGGWKEITREIDHDKMG